VAFTVYASASCGPSFTVRMEVSPKHQVSLVSIFVRVLARRQDKISNWIHMEITGTVIIVVIHPRIVCF